MRKAIRGVRQLPATHAEAHRRTTVHLRHLRTVFLAGVFLLFFK
ncbi:UNVERIFIED_CONTAM: hypothetical protein GTU68_044657 [Idotea baltica]|nr:hypothetical protein [Idotea baltica]